MVSMCQTLHLVHHRSKSEDYDIEDSNNSLGDLIVALSVLAFGIS